MRRYSREQKHVFDALFVLLLFFIFLLCALSVVVIGSSVYNRVTTNMNEHFTNKTAISYIVEKVRQNDVNGGLELVEIEDIYVLQIRQSGEDQDYLTLIYVYNGQLMELFVGADNLLPLAAGEPIMDVNLLQLEQRKEGLFSITITDEHGNTDRVLLSERSVR